MPFSVSCPSCAARLRVPDALAGRAARCPRCAATVPVPPRAAVAPPPPGAPKPLPVEELPEVDDGPADVLPVGGPYEDDHGAAPRAPRGRPTEDDRTLAMLIHLLGIVSGFVGPLVLWLMKREQSRFVDHQGRQALNFHITLAIASIVLFIVSVPLSILTCGFGMLVVIPLLLGIALFGLILSVVAGLRAREGVWYEYPLAIRLL